MNEPKTCVIVYTDGGASPNPGLGGWGAVLVSPGHGGLERELYGAEPDTTNNRHTDSTYLRNAFEKGWLERWRRNGWRTSGKQTVLNRDLWEELWELSRTHSICWHWVKGHAGDERNNRCDALVQRAKEEFLSGMSPAAPA